MRPKCVQMPGVPGKDFFNFHNGKFAPPAEQKSCKVMIVADAPKREDDRKGKGFQSDAGELLFKILEKADADYNEIYLTHLVKCMTPKGRDAAAPEIDACLHHVYREIRMLRPKVVVVLGRLAMKLFFGNKGKIGTMRGQLFWKKLPFEPEGPEFAVVPTYQPTYLLARPDPKLQARIVHDFKMAFRVADGLPEKQVVYPIEFEPLLTLDAVRDAVAQMRENGRYSFDTESPDLHFRSSPMILAQFSIGKGKTWVLPVRRHDAEAIGEWKNRPQWSPEEFRELVEILRPLMEDPNIHVFGANIKYDCNVFRAWFGLEVTGHFWDVGLMHHLLLETPPHSLEYLADLEFAIGNYSEDVHDIVGSGKKLRHTYDWIPDRVLWPYGATDAEMSYRLAEVYIQELQSKPHLMDLYLHETRPMIKVYQDAEWVGVRVDKKAVAAAYDYYSNVMMEIEAECTEMAGPGFNPGSSDQVAKFLIAEGFGEQIKNVDKSKGISVSKDVLPTVDHPISRLVMKYRNAKKRISTYVNNLQEESKWDGRVRFGFKINGTASGRLTCSVIHQIPKLGDCEDEAGVLRGLFVEDPDFDLLYYDFDQFQLRIFAYLTGEEGLITALEDPDQDVHTQSAAYALGCELDQVSDLNRAKLGKALNFGGLFGSKGDSVATLQFEDPKTGQILTVGDARAKEFMVRLNAKYPKIGALFDELTEEVLFSNGVVKTVFGRERHVPDTLHRDEYKRATAEREGVNFKIQSAEASHANRTVCLIRQAMLQHNVGLDRVRLLLTVHDSAVYGVHKSLTPWFKEVVKIVAERPIPELRGKSFPVSMGVGASWAKAEKNSKG